MHPDALLRPVGPLPARVYWVRRVLALALLALLLLLLTRLFGGGGDEGTSPGATAGTPKPTPIATGAGSARPASTPPGGGVCPDVAMRVSATTGAQRYPTGTLPQLTVTVTNTGDRPCSRDLAATKRTLTVLSGTQRIWSSADCASATPVVQMLQPGLPVVLPVAWNRRRSIPGCAGASPAPLAEPGTYRLRGQLDGLPPVDGGSFTLS